VYKFGELQSSKSRVYETQLCTAGDDLHSSHFNYTFAKRTALHLSIHGFVSLSFAIGDSAMLVGQHAILCHTFLVSQSIISIVLLTTQIQAMVSF